MRSGVLRTLLQHVRHRVHARITHISQAIPIVSLGGTGLSILTRNPYQLSLPILRRWMRYYDNYTRRSAVVKLSCQRVTT